MAAPLPSHESSVERLQKVVDFVGDLIPARGLEIFSNPEQKTRITVFQSGLFRWTRSDDDGQAVDYFDMPPAGAVMRYGAEQLCKALVETSVGAFSRLLDEAFAGPDYFRGVDRMEI
jgi:fermentation-respiration switch protein FrsA (DUF1100 family)